MKTIYELIQDDNIEAVEAELRKNIPNLANQLSAKGFPPLAYVKSANMAQILIDYGADVNLEFSHGERKWSILLFLVRYCTNLPSFVKDFDISNPNIRSINNDQIKYIIEIILKNGANPNYKISVPFKFENQIDYIIDESSFIFGTKIHEVSKRIEMNISTILGLACIHCNPLEGNESVVFSRDIIQLLVYHGAIIDEKEIKSVLLNWAADIRTCFDAPGEKMINFRNLFLFFSKQSIDFFHNSDNKLGRIDFYSLKEVKEYYPDEDDHRRLNANLHNDFIKKLKQEYKRDYVNLMLVCSDVMKEFNKIASESREGIVTDENGTERAKIIKSADYVIDNTTIFNNVANKLINSQSRIEVDDKFTKALKKYRDNNKQSYCKIL